MYSIEKKKEWHFHLKFVMRNIYQWGEHVCPGATFTAYPDNAQEINVHTPLLSYTYIIPYKHNLLHKHAYSLYRLGVDYTKSS